ncbi:MAG TPA: HAD-IA family hydrolase [Thermoanaerobaculia bacterium]|nr:HAD-IA family hydrolase [Thermoanaerobaculia bacterium]
MGKQFDFVTFDCYGTLIDWETGIRSAFLAAAAEDGVRLDPSLIIPAYADVERVVEGESYRSYRDVLAETALRTGHALGWRVTYGGFLADSLPQWRPFDDTNPALERLRGAGIRLGILSNIDDDLLSSTRRHFTVDFDLIVTAQQVGSYKPAPMHFLTARERVGAARWLHAAQSNEHDIVPANALGIANAWINRKSGRPLAGGTPTHEFRDLRGLADALT